MDEGGCQAACMVGVEGTKEQLGLLLGYLSGGDVIHWEREHEQSSVFCGKDDKLCAR